MTDTATLTAGREMDALVAEHVFDLTVRRHWPCWWYDAERAYVPCQSPVSPGGVVEQYDCVSGREGDFTVVPAYSTDIAAAWTVFLAMMEKLFSQRQAFYAALQDEATRKYPQRDDRLRVAWPDVIGVLRKDFPAAICRAALAVTSP